ncbi:hypothetical protein PG990_009943 [Apiospora arundinis]
MSGAMNHPWILSSPGVYTQTHDSFGQFFANWVTGEAEAERTSIIVVSVVKINARYRLSKDVSSGRVVNASVMESRLRRSWTAMVDDHPGLAVEFGTNLNTYRVPNSENRKAWLDATFLVHPGMDARELTRSLKRESHPRLHWLPTTNEMVLTAHHCYTDARGTWVFWDAYLEKVVRATSLNYVPQMERDRNSLLSMSSSAGLSPPKLPPTRDDLLGLPAWPTIQGWMKAHDLVMSAVKRDMVLLPPRTPLPAMGEPKDWPAGPGDYLRASISEAQTSAVVAACRNKGITVAAASYAALATVTRAMQVTEQESGGIGRYAVSFHHFDIRPWLHSSASHKPTGNSDISYSQSVTNTCALGVDYHVVVPYALDMIDSNGGTEEGTVSQERPMDDLAKEMNRFFQSTRRDFGQDPTGLDALTYYVQSIFGPATPAPNAPIFSSLGVAEDFIRRSYCGGVEEEGYSLGLEVEDTYVMTLGAKLMNSFMLHTFRGRLHALGGFDESYFNPKVFEDLLPGTLAKLLDWLDIEH